MKNITSLLKQHAPKPPQPLADNFTQAIMAEIKNGKARPRLGRWLHISRVGALSIVTAVLVGSTAAALTFWPHPTVTPTVTKQLPSGNHIVGYDATNCNYFSRPEGQRPTSDQLYYEIRQGSKLTDDQLKDSLRAICEENMSNDAINAIVKQLPKEDLKGMQSTDNYTVDAISKSSISVSLDAHYSHTMFPVKAHETFTRFSNHLIIRDQDNSAMFEDIKAGDNIKMIVNDDSGKSSENAKPYTALDHPEHITILAMLKVPPLTGDPSIFYSAVGSDLVRVEACSTSPTGFCRAYDFVKQ